MRILLGLSELNQKFGPLGFQHGLASISAVLKKNGFADVSLAHICTQEDVQRWDADLARIKPDVVAFYSTAEQFHFVRRLIERTPAGIFTIVGGPHPTCYPACIERVPRLDAICVGEGEYPMLELVTALKEGRDPSGILSLHVRVKGGIVRNPTRPFVHNLDELPYEDYELFHAQQAIDQYGLAQIRVMTSRGCPYHCTYCSNKRISETQSGRYVRFRSAGHVLGELNELKRRYRFEEIFFDDDVFMMNREILGEFCRRYPAEIGKPFTFCGRVEMCSREMLDALRKAGGRRIDFGVESGNEALRRSILKRNMSNRQIVEATRMAQAAGLQVKTLNMVGLPDETPAMHADTVKLNREIRPDVVAIAIFCPYPGTDSYDYCVAKGYYKPDEELPENYVSRRDTLLHMPCFAPKDIRRCFQLFGFRVFRGRSLVKAMGYLVIHLPFGEAVLEATKRYRKFLRKLVKGY